MIPKEIFSAPVLQNTIKNVFHNLQFDIVERPGAFILLLKIAPEDQITRILVLKPRGFTSNNLEELSSHPEAREATIEIKGIVRKGKLGYVLVKNCLEFIFYPDKQANTVNSYPYAKADKASRILKNARTRFKVVKSNGFGFYHNLVNLTDEWLVLILRKKLDLTKPIPHNVLATCRTSEKQILFQFLKEVRKKGDSLFSDEPGLVKKVMSLNARKSLVALIYFLNVPESGKHEQCTVFAVTLKIAKQNPKIATNLIKQAIANKTAPAYYLTELIKKLRNARV